MGLALGLALRMQWWSQCNPKNRGVLGYLKRRLPWVYGMIFSCPPWPCYDGLWYPFWPSHCYPWGQHHQYIAGIRMSVCPVSHSQRENQQKNASLCVYSTFWTGWFMSQYSKEKGGATLPGFTFCTASFPYHHSLILQVLTQILEVRLKSRQTVRNYVVFRITDLFQWPRLSPPIPSCLVPTFLWNISLDVSLAQSLNGWDALLSW